MSAPNNMPWCPRCRKHYPVGDKTGHCINPGLDEKLDCGLDARQRWHLGQKLTAEESRKIWGKA